MAPTVNNGTHLPIVSHFNRFNPPPHTHTHDEEKVAVVVIVEEKARPGMSNLNDGVGSVLGLLVHLLLLLFFLFF